MTRTFAADSPMIVNCAAYAEGQRIGDIPIEEIGRAVREGQLVWVGLYEPDEDLMKLVQEQLHLHDLAVEDAHRAHQRPKLEEYGEDAVFVVLRTVQQAEGEIAFGETHLFIGKGYVVTIRHGASLPYVDVRVRCERMPELLRTGGTWFVLYALTDFVVDQYLPIVNGLEDQLESIEAGLFRGQNTRETTERIYDLKRDLLGIKHAVAPLVEMFHKLARLEAGHLGEETVLYFRDVYDHVVRINQNVDNLRELSAAVLEANLSLISIQQNDVMKKLAAYAAIFAAPTMIAGIYGMNFSWMPGLAWPYGFVATIGGMVTICTLLYRLFKRADWI